MHQGEKFIDFTDPQFDHFLVMIAISLIYYYFPLKVIIDQCFGFKIDKSNALTYTQARFTFTTVFSEIFSLIYRNMKEKIL